MEGLVTHRQDAASDYGSDFTPDEEDILNALLKQPPDQPPDLDNPNRDTDLLLKDIEEDEGPRGARLPRRVERKHWTCYSLKNISPTDKEKHVRIAVHEDEGNLSAKGRKTRRSSWQY